MPAVPRLSDFDVQQHPRRPHLHRLLQDRLPALGLDPCTYGPYVWGDEDSTDSDEDLGGDELEEVVVGVLQASSETHAEDDGAWTELIAAIARVNQLDRTLRKEAREQKLLETKTKMEEDLAKAKLEEQKQPPSSQEQPKKSSQVDDATKKLLVQRYGYDEPAEAEGSGSGFGANGNSGSGSKQQPSDAKGSAASANNKEAAKAAYLQKSREIRKNSQTTKAEERKKTKEQKQSKADLKEARRKRAQKGERRA